MEILGFLLGLGCLVLIVWAIALFGSLVFGRKRRRQNRPHEQPPSLPQKSKQQIAASDPPPVAEIPTRQVVTVALKQLPVSSRVRLQGKNHQQYIRLAELVLEQLRSGEVQLPKALSILRKMNPYAFEELLLTCCQEQGWKIERNFRYTGDGGIDGRVLIGGKLYLIQAKRYRGYINPKHIRDFYQVIQGEKAAGGFFIHTGKTGEMSKELLPKRRITLISGQKLVDFVLGEQLRIVSVTIPVSLDGH